MIKEIKKSFDNALAAVLANEVHSTLRMRTLKKGIKLVSPTSRGNHGEINFGYLGGQKSYCFAMVAWSEEFIDYIRDIMPPYESNFPKSSDFQFYVSTFSENRGLYSRENGAISLLFMPDTQVNIMKHIATCLNEHYIPRLERFLTFSPELIHDVIKTPGNFSYPIPLIAYVIKKNNLNIENYRHLIGRKMFKNSKFDKELLGLD